MKIPKLICVVSALSLGLIRPSFANVGEMYGFGSRMSALGAAGASGYGAEAFVTYYNPAGLSVEREKRLRLNWGIFAAQTNFHPIGNIVTQNRYTGDGIQVGDADVNYRATFGQALGLSYQLFPDFLNTTIGLTTFMPFNQLAFFDTGDAFVPEFVLYRARTQRPQLEFGLGSDLGSGFHFGLGFHFAFSLASNASVFINTNSATSISTMRFAASMTPKLAPYFGVIFTPAEDPKKYSIGGVLRLPATTENSMVLSSAARVFGDFAAVDFSFSALSALFYDPMALELGASWQHSSGGRLYAQLEYQFWSNYQIPALVIQQPQTTNCRTTTGGPCSTVTIAPGAGPQLTFVNIWVPRIAEEVNLSDVVTLRASYGYRPSILSDVPSGSGNYLDPPKHMLNLGLGLSYQHFLGFPTPCRIDFNFLFHYFVLQRIVKTAGNEAGDATDQKIGSPGYNAGGNIGGAGISLSLAF